MLIRTPPPPLYCILEDQTCIFVSQDPRFLDVPGSLKPLLHTYRYKYILYIYVYTHTHIIYIRIYILYIYIYTYNSYSYNFKYVYIYTYLEVASPHILAFWPSVLEPSQEPDPTTSITGSSSCRAGLPTWSIQDCAHLVAAANMMFSFDIFSRGVYISIHGIYIYI